MRSLASALAAASLSVLLGSCDSPPAVPASCGLGPLGTSCPTPQVAEGCQTTVSVSVRGGVTPEIDWAPQCGINHVVVVGLGGQSQPTAIFWSFSASALVRPSLRYGSLPAGAILEGPTRPLEPDKLYRVTLEMIQNGTLVTGRGSVVFRP